MTKENRPTSINISIKLLLLFLLLVVVMVASDDDGGFTTTFLYVAFNKHLDL